ncbi:hypothetical protein Scep_016086 [Stephania cephalantha]|uniref:Uncharacterized protein n=1 Tax=Stephania cephalantha TaxID=152367 RepID=A0AAP0IN56_9MAGN
MIHDSNLSRFKSEIQSTQEHQFSLLRRDTEKLRIELQRETEKIRTELQRETEKIRTELRYQIDKVTVGQKAESANLNNKLDQVSHAMREQLEAAKYDVIKYSIGTLVSISAVGLAVIRILM